MTTYPTSTDQRGFFDFGLGLALLAVFGAITAAGVLNPASTEQQQRAACIAVGDSGADCGFGVTASARDPSQ